MSFFEPEFIGLIFFLALIVVVAVVVVVHECCLCVAISFAEKLWVLVCFPHLRKSHWLQCTFLRIFVRPFCTMLLTPSAVQWKTDMGVVPHDCCLWLVRKHVHTANVDPTTATECQSNEIGPALSFSLSFFDDNAVLSTDFHKGIRRGASRCTPSFLMVVLEVDHGKERKRIAPYKIYYQRFFWF